MQTPKLVVVSKSELLARARDGDDGANELASRDEVLQRRLKQLLAVEQV
jgi:hypothetical protein